MSSGNGPSRSEAVVKARYFVPIEPEEKVLRRLQRKLTMQLMQQGFHQMDVDPDPFGPAQRTMDFRRMDVPQPEDDSLTDRVKGWFKGDSPGQSRDISTDEFLEGLQRFVDSLPFRLVFHFTTVEGEEQSGYDVLIESTPALLQKYRQLNPPDDYSYNLEDVVEENKAEIQRIMGNLELEPYYGPYTDAELVDPVLSESTIESLEQHEYGRNAVHYLEEGDQSLQHGLLNAALSCYIHAIEWAILYYKDRYEEVDLVEEQRNAEKYFTLNDLIQKIEKGTPASQKSISKLQNINSAERRWAAHHKTGDVERKDVENVRVTLFRLVDEFNDVYPSSPPQ